MHWTERTRAVVAIGEELQRRGWTLYGYHPDRSDPLTDYYAPAGWRGVAVKGDAVVCVDVGKYEARYSEQDIVEHTATSTTVIGRWPKFQANPKGKTWHIERAGRIVASGVGLQGCAHWDASRTAPAVRDLCDRIEAAAWSAPRVTLTAHPGSAPATTRERRSIASGVVEGDVPFTAYEEGDWTWIAFGSKPSDGLRQRLKQAGGRWGQKRGAWCFKRTGLDLAALGLAGPPAPPAEAAPADEGDPAAPGEPDPAADSSPATSAAVEPTQDAGDHRLAELGCPGCGLTFHGMVGSTTAVPDPARCPCCGTVGVVLDEDALPAHLAETHSRHSPATTAPAWSPPPQRPSASGNATRHAPSVHVAEVPIRTVTGQLVMFE